MPEQARNEALDAARERRIQLKEAVSAVEIAAAAPSADHNWQPHLVARLEDLRIALDDHVEEVEGPGGLLAQLTQDAPRLANKINRVRDEHPALCQQVADVIALAKEPGSATEIRGRAVQLLVDLVRHRQHGADLVYEGYSVDIGGG